MDSIYDAGLFSDFFERQNRRVSESDLERDLLGDILFSSRLSLPENFYFFYDALYNIISLGGSRINPNQDYIQ